MNNNNFKNINKKIKVEGLKESRILDAFYNDLVTEEAVTDIQETAGGFLERGYSEDELFFSLDIEEGTDHRGDPFIRVFLKLCSQHGGLVVSWCDGYIHPKNTKEQNEAVEAVLYPKEED